MKNIINKSIYNAVELRYAFAKALVELGKKNKKVVVLDADLCIATGTNLFAKLFPERFFQLGIAEQNMMGVAAGLATSSLIPFATTLAVFSSKRAHDQVSISIAYTNLNVKILGAYSGISSPDTGATHQSIDDIAIMRAMPNMKVVVPGDPVEVNKAVFSIVEEEGPVYLRIAKSPQIYPIFNNKYKFEIGKGIILREGTDVTLISTGIMTAKCLEVVELLKKEKIEATVLHMPTIKPIDKQKIIEVVKKTGAIVTVENHSIIGGLGSAVAEILCENILCPLERVGIMDTFCESAMNIEDLFRKYGLNGEKIVRAAKNVIKRKVCK